MGRAVASSKALFFFGSASVFVNGQIPRHFTGGPVHHFHDYGVEVVIGKSVFISWFSVLS
jgi:hypothetical protein